ncbi:MULTISPECIES: response regulator [Leptolyngbya]|jgi:DNA-binding response OmpR family regulator|uniref:Response regulator receiver protein n=2 Tax=Leptolyngbya boryana TaxID=1184 RepID=A0A1Z4JML9_LEPBY|nr:MULTISPECIES: response regulator [Leptolyngbya]BAY57898.1 response regulator receiver protein [Leptolyngbya boryana NIES-2135]MBD1854534.1 response regulator [Leptolyngbya sp. FACHB-1624]MBD2367343.1 response regulator [Leptolyngbya sp. FACHB-161]MBD2373867.1 response regulator [Leptolyngbya sp. FACHB-238]MBD2398333.1 response regulator [Leptolyngbya sp. FACHB-239]
MTTDQETGAIDSIRILLIEDNEPNRRLLEDYLVYQGFEVQSLATGTGFERALTDFKPQIVLLDLKLPDMDGCDILERMQESPDWREIPVIVVSARAFIADQRRALGLGAQRYLVKPIRLLELLEVIRSVLG